MRTEWSVRQIRRDPMIRRKPVWVLPPAPVDAKTAVHKREPAIRPRVLGAIGVAVLFRILASAPAPNWLPAALATVVARRRAQLPVTQVLASGFPALGVYVTKQKKPASKRNAGLGGF